MSQTLFLLYHPEPARPMSKAKSVGAHSICARGSLSYRKRARADMESAPTFFCGGRRGARFSLLRVSGRPLVARQLTAATHFPGQFSCKASGHGRAMLAPTRVFASLSPKYSCPPHGSLPHRLRAEPPRRGGQEGRAFFRLSEGNGFIFSFALSKTILCGILFSTSPQANPVQTGDAKL